MSSAKLAAACAVTAVALSACGTTTQPVAGSAAAKTATPGHASLDDPRAQHIPCLRANHLQVTEFGQTGIQIGTPPAGPTITFTPTPGSAQDRQITNSSQAAEVIGSALLYPNQATDAELGAIEACLAQGVKG